MTQKVESARTCKNCDYWRGPYADGSGVCDHDKLNQDINQLDLDGLGQEIWEAICTGPEFGCIHWEEAS
jgi:hypothetical protein